MVDSADRLSSPMRTAKKRHSEQAHATPKRRKVDEDISEPEPEPMDIPDEAQREKELGNAAYKKKDFETAIQHYKKEMDLDDVT